ncbi:MAG: 50S ribosomal protein L11 methyltransferase [Proteobacteria bacterium]|nr:50S ribosomal protein L11 methyltransferase [Pseudomonadota bacterium]
MSWIEISFETFKPQAQTFSDLLEELGAVSVSFFDASNQPILEPKPGKTPLWQKVKMVGLFPADFDTKPVLQALKNLLPNTSINQSTLAEQDWSRTWLEHFKPIQFGEKLWVIPSDSPPPEQTDAVIIKLDPGLAFGTGTHATTALCLRWLDAHPPLNQTVVDYGCGSGILGIGALKLGAQKVHAIDYDPQALTATLENRIRNEIVEDKLSVYLPEDAPKDLNAELILANILAEPLISLCPTFAALLNQDGNLVMSGLLTKQIEAVTSAYDALFIVREIQTEDEWALLWLVRK